MVATIIGFLVVFGLTVVALVWFALGLDREVRRSGPDEGDRAADQRDAPGVGPPGGGP